MVLNSYDGHRSFYIYNMLDAQKLYNSARNIELASWLIRTKYDSDNNLFLLSSGEGDELNPNPQTSAGHTLGRVI
jgi:hypothetical protein